MSKIEIINPIAGGMRYTSADRARSFCISGMGEMHGDRLYFYTDTQDNRSAEQEFLRNRGGILLWNGAVRDPSAIHGPGEVRS